jgi:hypothetical protein
MQIILFIIIGLIPAVAIRYVIVRNPMSPLAASATCFAVLVGVAILVSTATEKKSQTAGDEPIAGGPITLLADLVGGMVKVGVPVVIASWFILRGGPNRDSEG